MYSTEINIKKKNIKKPKHNEPIENKINLRKRIRAESWLAEHGRLGGCEDKRKGGGTEVPDRKG